MMDQPPENPWAKRYRDLADDAVLQQKLRMQAVRADDLTALPAVVASTRLSGNLASVFWPGTAIRQIIKAWMHLAAARAEAIYPERATLVRYRYRPEEIPDSHHYPFFLTGPAGVGKTELRKALVRALGPATHILIDESHGCAPLLPVAIAAVENRRSPAQVLRPLAGPDVASGAVKLTEPDLIEACRSELVWSGACLLGCDEMQFLAQSPEAGALISRILLAISSIGLPMFYIGNYSLGWRLRNRPQEVRQRLLAAPLVLLPDPPESADWISLLGEYDIVCADCLSFKLVEHPVELWNLCAGLKRELVKLVAGGYLVARQRGVQKATFQDLLNFYQSSVFSASRRDIEQLVNHGAQGTALPEDLRCPIEGGEVAQRVQEYSKHLHAVRKAKVQAAVSSAGLTKPERDALAALEKPEFQKLATVTPIRGKQKKATRPADLIGLIDAGRAFGSKRDEVPREDLSRGDS